MKKPQIHIDTEPSSIRELIRDHRWVVIKNKQTVPPKELVDFYRSLGTLYVQDNSFMSDEYIEKYSDGFRELVPVRNKRISGYGEDGLFAGEEDGEVLWHNASNNHDPDEDVIGFSIRQLGNGGALSLCDTQLPYQQVRNKHVYENIEAEYPLDTWKSMDNEAWNFTKWKSSDGTPYYKKENQFKPIVTTNPLNELKGFSYPFPAIINYKNYPYKSFEHLHKHIQLMLMDYVNIHHFEEGDIILQEQHHTLHRRAEYTGDRLLYRTAIWF